MPSFAVTPLTDHTGAEVVGLDLPSRSTPKPAPPSIVLANHHVL